MKIRVLVIAILLTIGANVTGAADWYVRAGASADGDGTVARPFDSFAAAEAASAAGDTIFVRPAPPSDVLDGGIVLKPGQRLIGTGPDVRRASASAVAARVTNTTGYLRGTIVSLSSDNEIEGIHFLATSSDAIVGFNGFSGAKIHHNLFTRPSIAETILSSISLIATGSEVVADVFIHDNEVRDGVSLRGFLILLYDSSSGEFLFESNDFSDLGGRPHIIQTLGDSRASVVIRDSTANNIGVGGRNSDSILPYLLGSSEQDILVQNYSYDNSDQVGNASNTGTEAFIVGNGNRLTYTIEDSEFRNAVTDAIQLVNYGQNTTLDVTIRNTKVIMPYPRQVGAGISLLAGLGGTSGHDVRLMVENSDVVGSALHGFAVIDNTVERNTTVDYGGGSLGSEGNNRIIGSAGVEISLQNADVVARHNWWGGIVDLPRTKLVNATVDYDPILLVDPRPRSTPLTRVPGSGQPAPPFLDGGFAGIGPDLGGFPLVPPAQIPQPVELEGDQLVVYFDFENTMERPSRDLARGGKTTFSIDKSGNGLHGEWVGGLTEEPSLSPAFGQAIRFPGELGVWIDLDGANFPREKMPVDEYTVAAWIKPEPTNDWHVFFNAWASFDWVFPIYTLVSPDGVYFIHNESREEVTLTADVVFGDPQPTWFHYASTFSQADGEARIYINGELAGSVPIAADLPIADNWNGGARIGTHMAGTFGPFKGLMDEFVLYNHALTLEEIQDLMANGPGK